MQGKKLTIHDIEVPQGMIAAYEDAGRAFGFAIHPDSTPARRLSFAAALLWLAENPIVPTNADILACAREFGVDYEVDTAKSRGFWVMWQRRMFLKPEPEDAPELKALLWDVDLAPTVPNMDRHRLNELLREAFAAGKAAPRE